MLAYWISIDVAEHATSALIILTWTNFVLSLTGPLTNFLVGIGRLKVLTRTSVSAAVLNAILLVILLPLSGIYGASLAYLFALVPYVVLFYWTETHFLELTGRVRFYLYFALKLGFTGLVTFIFNQYVLVQYIYNFPSVLVVSGISISFFIFIYYICGLFEKEDVRDIQHFARNILRLQKKVVE
jgi:O-antigen/teichoic acid export membrane protein